MVNLKPYYMATQPRSYYHYDIKRHGSDVGYLNITGFDNDRWDGEAFLFDGAILSPRLFSQYSELTDITRKFLKYHEDDGYELWGERVGQYEEYQK